MLYPVAIIYDELEQLVSVSCIYHRRMLQAFKR